MCCTEGFLEIAQWMTDEFGLTRQDICENNTLSDCCEEGHIDVVEWMLDTFYLTEYDVCDYTLGITCENGHLEVAQLITETLDLGQKYIEWQNYYALRKSRENGRDDIVEWLQSKFELNDV